MRKFLITGAGSGIGLACVRHFLGLGESVIALDRNVTQLVPLEREYGGKVLIEAVDLLDRHSVSVFFERLDSLNISPDVLVNAAGIREIIPALELTTEEFERVIGVNLVAPFSLSRECAKRWTARDQPGVIINISSVSGVMAEPSRAAYVSSKHGLIGLTKQLAMEFGTSKIRVNSISPGVIRTELTEPYFNDPALIQLICDNHALGRWGEPADVVACVDFLASGKAGFVTGANFMIDGGWTAGKRL